jgi:Predicted transcriptional regulators
MTAKAPYDTQACKLNRLAIRDSLELIGGKWSLLVVLLLGRQQEPMHFKQIQRALDGISAKVLTRELKLLEENRILNRTVQDTLPVTVTYALTDYGKTLVPIVRALQQWGKQHREVILENFRHSKK